MHTEEKPKGKGGKHKGIPEQVANNTAEHYEIVLTETATGEYRFDIHQLPSPQLIRGQYWVIGNKMIFPKSWGKEKGARYMLEQLRDDAQRMLDSATERMNKIQALGELIESSNWSGID